MSVLGKESVAHYHTLCESLSQLEKIFFQQNSMWTWKSTISCGSVSLVSISFEKAVQILEKGTTPICVSDLRSVKSSCAKTDPFTSQSSRL